MRGLVVVAAIVVLLTASTGCTDDSKPKSLPSLSPTPGSSSPTPSGAKTGGMSDKEQVRAIYRASTIHYDDGQDMSRKERREYYAQWSVDPALSEDVDAMQKSIDTHMRSYGHQRPRIMSIRVRQRTAQVDDCVDQSGYRVRNTKSGKLVDEDKADRYWIVANFRKTAAGWRIREGYTKDEACENK